MPKKFLDLFPEKMPLSSSQVPLFLLLKTFITTNGREMLMNNLFSKRYDISLQNPELESIYK